MSSFEPRNGERHVAIIGAGLAGIAAALELKKQLGCERFTIYEKGDSVGGVWRDNTYPGCGSDVAAHWYSLSSELNPNWPSRYVSQPEIRAYWERVYNKHALAAHTCFHTEVVQADWDENERLYHITLEDARSKEQRIVNANVVWWAAGAFYAPFFPDDVSGVKDFKGDVWHSARWNHNVDLRGKRVGVIGNGCSGAQFIPRISEDPSVQVTNFVRSQQWFVPRAQFEYSATVKAIFRYVPGIMRAYRACLYWKAELGFLTFNDTGNFMHKAAIKGLTEYIRKVAPEKHIDKLIPAFPPGCKRVVLDPGYLASLHRPNVDLNWTPIDSVCPEGLRLATGEVVPLDVIIFATGFSTLPPRLQVSGRHGETLSQFFDSVGGPAAYLGLAVPHFPNLFMLLGPNTAGGHASVIFNEEVQIDHALQLMRPILKGKADAFEVKESVFTQYNEWIQKRLARSVWAHCRSYYRGRTEDGRNYVIFPGPVTLFWWLAHRVRFSRYNATGAEIFERERRMKRWASVSAIGVLAVSVMFARRSGWTLPMLAQMARTWITSTATALG
ncbi:FAD/NAD-binding domain-containing protein [Peniophora sp. CONT]|nr:FAD/NAD-binding domain-containing protein [Peniophora sp. CONT]